MSEQEEDFAAMLEASFQTRRVSQGESVEGTIVSIGRDVALVDIGGKSEAVLEVGELKDADGDIEFNVGDRIQAVVVSTAHGVTLSRRLARGAATDRQIEDAFHSRLPVEGTVQGVVKGGYEVRVGRSRGFCPFSQIDIVRTENPETHIGRTYAFRITEYKDGGRNLVVSRRALLEEEQEAQAAEVRRTLVPGAVVKGRVVTVRDYGAFVDLGGGIQGLLHVSEMGWSRVADTAQVVAAGEEISVQVLRVDEGTNKIALGLKQLTADPWTTVPERYTVSEVYQGRVTRLAPFGAFVELEPGVEALAHVSTFPPSGRRDAWMAQVPAGATAAFEILTIDLDQKRIGVALVPEGSTRAAGAVTASGALVPGTRLTGKVERHERFGVFVFLGPGRTALMPTSETGVDRDADLARTFPVGSDVEVMVLEVDSAGRRITVSRKAVFDAQEAEELREYAARPDAAPAERLGSLADKLKGAWGQK